MDIRRNVRFAALALSTAACGDPEYDKAPGFERLCDGSENIRFMAGIALNGRDEGDGRMLSQNGLYFFLVRGDCQYWVHGGVSMDRSYGGHLSSDEESEFANAFHYGEWQSRGIDRDWDNPNIVDGGWLVFADGAAKVGCYECRDASGVPNVVREMAYEHGRWFGRLQRLGTPLDGALHVIAVEGSFNIFDQGATWPLDWPITDIAITLDEFQFPPGDPYQNTLITDPNDTAALRAIWDEYLSGAHGDTWKRYLSIPFEDATVPGQRFSVQMRDALPMEDEVGYIYPFS